MEKESCGWGLGVQFRKNIDPKLETYNHELVKAK